MIQVSLDTSFLISFADPDRENHAVALEYFRYCSAERIPMWISTIAADALLRKNQLQFMDLEANPKITA